MKAPPSRRTMLEALEPRRYLTFTLPASVHLYQPSSPLAAVITKVAAPTVTASFSAAPKPVVPTVPASPTPANSAPLNIYTRNMTSFIELAIDGTAGNDSILITQSNGTLTITGNGHVTSLANTFGDIVIHGFAGDDSITVDSSVNIATLLYGGDGNDTLINRTSAKATIVDIDSSANRLTGNGINTSFWANPADTINASAAEIANGAVNRVTAFYQPSFAAVPRTLKGQNLADPIDSGFEFRLNNNSFWGTGPTMADVVQGQVADCFYLAPLASLAASETVKFMNTAVDLGDGTYAVRFIRNGATSYVRVDGEIAFRLTHPGPSGNLWASIYEKAYAFFRTGAATYASLSIGYLNDTFTDLGFANGSLSANAGDAALLAAITSSLAAHKALAANTHVSIVGGAPLITRHVYTVVGAWRDASGTLQIQLRNPWGVDGAGNDGNYFDGFITIPYTAFAANFYSLAYTTS